ncbi:PbpA [bacterium]|nr:PbpA [bacterium]
MDLDTLKEDNSWRTFQEEYILKKKKKRSSFNFIKTVTVSAILLIAVAGFFIFKSLVGSAYQPSGNKNNLQTSDGDSTKLEFQIQKEQQTFLSKQQLNSIIKDINFNKSDKNIFFVDTPEENYKITTSIDVNLQGFLLSKMSRLKTLTRGKPEKIAIVVMEPDTGKIIAMAGFDLNDTKANPCISSIYPAASIFKVITASAAIQSLNYNPDTQLYFNGNKYTLYKRQLKDVKNKYTSNISFSSAFAESVNPVFGKIGKNYLGKQKLDLFATAFGFNQDVDFELPFVSGTFMTNSDKYHLAELGCGFNRNTTISPVYGAMIASAVINSGSMMLPIMVEHVTNSSGKIIYKPQKSKFIDAIEPKTAATMVKLMEKTVAKGTAKKTFRGFSKDKTLSKLIIGGKTGSLSNKKHTVKYDWFIGFGKDKKTKKPIALSIVVGHRKYIGTRATSYAKMILKKHFK